MRGWGYGLRKKRSDINYALSDQMNWAGIKLAAAPRAEGSCLYWGDTAFTKSWVRFSSVWLSTFAVLQLRSNAVLGSNGTHTGRCTKEGHVGFGAGPALLTVITPLRLSGGWSCYRCFMMGTGGFSFCLSDEGQIYGVTQWFHSREHFHTRSRPSPAQSNTHTNNKQMSLTGCVFVGFCLGASHIAYIYGKSNE